MTRHGATVLSVLLWLGAIGLPWAAWAATPYDTFRWRKPDSHLAYPNTRPLNAAEIADLNQIALPPSHEYSKHVTFVRAQGGGGCGAMASIAVLDILRERDYPFAPDVSYRFCQYFYDGSRSAPKAFWLEQGDVLQVIGCCPEGRFNSDYDSDPPPPPTMERYLEAASYRIARYSDHIAPFTVDQLKRLLVRYGPVVALGDVPAAPGFGPSPVDGHVFAIIGYNDATSTFTILNSYGDRWANNGMMAMPYASVAKKPPTQSTPRVNQIVYFVAAPGPIGSPFAARLNIHHNDARHHLVVKIGVEGQTPDLVWNHPNKTDGWDNSQNLVIDVPLPAYATQHWPPSEKNRWYVEVSDDSGPPAATQVAQINDIVLVQRLKNGQGVWQPRLYRAALGRAALSRGGTAKIEIPSETHPKLHLTVDHPRVGAGQEVTFSGWFGLNVKKPDGTIGLVPLPNRLIELHATRNDPIEQTVVLQTVGSAMTNAGGTFAIKVRIQQTGSYQALAPKADGTVDASSEVRVVQVR